MKADTLKMSVQDLPSVKQQGRVNRLRFLAQRLAEEAELEGVFDINFETVENENGRVMWKNGDLVRIPRVMMRTENFLDLFSGCPVSVDSEKYSGVYTEYSVVAGDVLFVALESAAEAAKGKPAEGGGDVQS